MKNPQLLSVMASIALLGACSIDSTDPMNPTSTGGTGGSATGTGGSAGPATGGTGQTATAGTTNSAGTGTGTSGSTATGGASGGSGPSGGAGGTGTGGGDLGGAPPIGGSSGATKWIGTWAASPYTAPSDAQPPAALANSVLRQVVHISIGGSQFRVQFSNMTGGGPVTIKSAHVALCKATPLVDSTIDVATDKALAFGGMEGVTIAAGMEVWSDAVNFTVPPLGNVSITTALGAVTSNITAHAGARTTSYVVAGSTDVSVAAMASAPKGDHWYYISGIDVMADASGGAVAAIGDSITDGRGTDTNGNNRWTDILAARLQANPATAKIGVLNQGIGATNLSGGGTAAEARFKRDVLGQSGIKYAIIYDGVNDIGGGAAFAGMKATYDKLIAAGRAAGIKVYGATIPPFGSNSYYSAGHEMVRKQVNDYVKMAGVFDGVVDFDMALTDGGNPPNLQAAFAAWAQKDGLHPGPDGYKKMGETPDLMLFQK